MRFFYQHPGIYIGQGGKFRRFLDGVFWVMRTGAPWRDVPKPYGNWNSIYQRYGRWCDREIWAALFAYFADDPDLEWLIPDSTIVRAHPCAAGAPQCRGGQESQALGKSKGGFSTKLHILVDGLGGDPLGALDFVLTGGQRHDKTQGTRLLQGFKGDYVIADKAYDADDLIAFILDDVGAEPVIPPRSNRTNRATMTRSCTKHVISSNALSTKLSGGDGSLSAMKSSIVAFWASCTLLRL